MANRLRLMSRLLAALWVALLSQAAFADPPGRVGRLADLQGQVWLYDIGAAEWVAASRNRPLTSGDRVATDAGARAEVRVGSTTLRLGAGTELELLQLDDDIVRLQLHAGALGLRLRTHEAAREFEFVTAEGRFKPDRAGRYRLDRVDATSSVTVWGGQLLFEARDNAVMLVPGQRVDVWNDGLTQYTLMPAQRDAFADEVAAADQSDERSVSAQYVSPEMTGAEDLDRYGRWQSDPDYGALWVPLAVAPGWVPYSFGYWAWIDPWGWTWVDDAPWGFAPFHYGRWVHQHNTWCWAPGRRVARPVYAPALVAWVGAPAAGASLGIGAGRPVGWFPLAPREVFVPGYRASAAYIRNVNLAHVANIGDVGRIVDNPDAAVQQSRYMNRGVPGAITVVPANVVSGRRPVAPARLPWADSRGRGDRSPPQDVLATLTAAPPIQAPVAHPGSGTAALPPGAPAPAGGQVRNAARPGAIAARPPGAVLAPAAPTAAAPQPSSTPAFPVPRTGRDGAPATDAGSRPGSPLATAPLRPAAPVLAAPPPSPPAVTTPVPHPQPPLPSAAPPGRPAPTPVPYAPRGAPPEPQVPVAPATPAAPNAHPPPAPNAPGAAPASPNPPLSARAVRPATAPAPTPVVPATPAADPQTPPAAPPPAPGPAAAAAPPAAPAMPKPVPTAPPRGREP